MNFIEILIVELRNCIIENIRLCKRLNGVILFWVEGIFCVIKWCGSWDYVLVREVIFVGIGFNDFKLFECLENRIIIVFILLWC